MNTRLQKEEIEALKVHDKIIILNEQFSLFTAENGSGGGALER